MTPGSTRPRPDDRGSVLMLMPAAVLIVLLLGAIAVDSAIVFLEQRRAYNVAFDAANDAAGAGFDLDVARRTGQSTYDPARVEAVARDAIDAAGMDGLVLVSAIPDGDAVVVTVRTTIEHLFVQVLGDPARDTMTVSARAEAEVRRPTAP